MPGRTDNEIKNFWNIRARKLKKASDLSNQKQVDISQVETSDIHGVKFKKDMFSGERPSISNEINGYKFEQLPNSFNVSITRPHVSNMQCNNVASTSLPLTNK